MRTQPSACRVKNKTIITQIQCWFELVGYSLRNFFSQIASFFKRQDGPVDLSAVHSEVVIIERTKSKFSDWWQNNIKKKSPVKKQEQKEHASKSSTQQVEEVQITQEMIQKTIKEGSLR